MKHRALLEMMGDSPLFRELGDLSGGEGWEIYGLPEGFKAACVAAVGLHFPFILVITTHQEKGEEWIRGLEFFYSPSELDLLPPWELLPLNIRSVSPQLAFQRIKALTLLGQGKLKVLVVPVETWRQKLPPPEIFREAFIHLTRGQEVPRDHLIKKLVGMGYLRVEVVEGPGQMAVRGGIVDVFPPQEERPIRIEFFGDEIESLRTFHTQTQRSIQEIPSVTLGPASENFLLHSGEDFLLALRRRLEEAWGKLNLSSPQAAMKLKREGEELLKGAAEGRVAQLPVYLCPQLVPLEAHLPPEGLIVVDDPSRIKEEAQRQEKLLEDTLSDMVAAGLIIPLQDHAFISARELFSRMRSRPRLFLSLLPSKMEELEGVKRQGVRVETPPLLKPDPRFFFQELGRWKREGYRIFFALGNRERAQNFKAPLEREGLFALLEEDVSFLPPEGEIILIPQSFLYGFVWPEGKLALVGERELYGRTKRAPRASTQVSGQGLSSWEELKEGDYVVHVHHGIGRYLGLKQLEIGGVKKDYLVLQYAGNDRLYVPVEQIALVQKYVGAEGHVPRLHRLGGGEWQKVKKRVQQAVEDMAKDLLELYAHRAALSGHAFSPDTPWQKEFEEAFPYQETPDQLRAIQEVKSDMEKPKPMDRLICGDVGFGKTEVALRAAFKAVMDGKQVAVLAPTTVLAQQHYRTFKERFAPFPIRIAVLSRFCPVREQREVIQKLKTGEIDIVIGTHRLLSEDVGFKDLGLLIIDEEQRFGVFHKEKLKKLRSQVDVLSVSATPIPRTLHMALAGLMDMSLIETPPAGRLPVQTYVVEYSPQLVKEAIRREMARGGQVYFVHNRILDIQEVAQEIKQLVPEARVAVAHGRMEEEELEKVMLDFIAGKYDVLVCTTIIESGLDIPNVNTLIVDESDKFGLSQLYQLRGRVGRSDRLAYAYFTYRPDRVLGELAEKRLQAIKEFTALGSGYKVALRDLEIRGAGNLLGPEQHGHMLAVGFDFYCQLLEEAVRKLKMQRESPPEGYRKRAPVPLELMVDTFLREDYIPSVSLKMEIYKRLMSARDWEEIRKIRQEVEDHFGPLPPEGENLFHLARLRVLAQELEIVGVQQKGEEVEIRLDHALPSIKGEDLLLLARRFPRRLYFSTVGGLSLKVRIKGLSQREVLSLLESILKELGSLGKEGLAEGEGV